MADDLNGIQVCVRVRPLNERERNEGFRTCISFDEATKQVVLSAVDKNTLIQLRGSAAKGYAFDRRFGPEQTSDSIYDDCVTHLVDNLFKGYNATVLAYGQTGSGKTLTMSGGVGMHGVPETGIIRRAAEHILANVQALKEKIKPGESIAVKAYALELYNEELRDLSSKAAAATAADSPGNGSNSDLSTSSSVRIAERPCGNGRCIPEVVGVSTTEVEDADSLVQFFSDCFDNRAVAATKMNDRSSRSHAIYTVLISRTLVDVSEGCDKVRTCSIESRFNLVDLAGSERVKRSGVTGAAFKEAVHINGGLLALGNVIVALSGGADAIDTDSPYGSGSPGLVIEGPASGRQSPVKAKHIPYRDSKLTRLLQDSLGGNALTVLISCISSCEADFEETNSTLKYANRACRIKNQPLPNKQLLLEEDLLPLLPANSSTGTLSMMQMQMLLAEHTRIKEARGRREAEKKEKEEKRMTELRALKEAEKKTPGYQRLRMAQYDDLRKKLISSHGTRALKGEVISDDTLAGFKKRDDSTGSDSAEGSGRPATASPVIGGSKRPASRPLATKANSASHLASIYGGAAARSCSSSTSGSPVPWEGAQTPSGGASPEVLMVEHRPEDSEQQQWQQQRREQQDEALQTDPLQDEKAEAGDAADAVLDSAGSHRPQTSKAKDSKDAMAMMDAICLPSDSSTTIKACYDLSAAETDSPAAAPAQPGRSTGGGSCSSTKSADAFEVLEFQPAQSEPQADSCVSPSRRSTQQEPIPAAASPPQLLARFRVNQYDTLAVFRAVSTEDFADVASLLPANTALPAADKMTYLLARLETHPQSAEQLSQALQSVANGSSSMNAAVGPAVGCLMVTFGTSLITDCIFDFEDPDQLQGVGMGQRLELWGLQIPHTAVRPALSADPATMPGAAAASAANSPCLSPEPRRGSFSSQAYSPGCPSSSRPATPQQCSSADHHQQQQEVASCWSSADRLNVSIGLMYALCNLAADVGAVAGFCVPRPQLLRRWLQAGVRMKQVSSPAKLIYPQSAHDYSYYKSSTVAYFMVDEVKESLTKVLCPPPSSAHTGSRQASQA